MYKFLDLGESGFLISSCKNSSKCYVIVVVKSVVLGTLFGSMIDKLMHGHERCYWHYELSDSLKRKI